MPRLGTKELLNKEIPLPTLDEQYHIAMVLDMISNLIALRKQQLDKLDELVKARFVEMFGDPVANPFYWETKRLDELCENLDSRRISITASERKPGIYPYYGASCIVDYVDDYIFDEDLLLISEDGANLVARVTPIPPANIQIDFYLFYEEILKNKLTMQQGLDKIEVMRKTLMQKYFG